VFRKAGRLFNPVTLLLAAVCFALPFAAVGCDTPGGYAGASAGGVSSYNGVALVIGGRPEVTEGHERPVPDGENDRLPPQPAQAAALLAILAACGLAIGVREVRTRRAAVTVVAVAAGAALLVGQLLVEAELTVRVADHLGRMAAEGVAIDPAKTARDYVLTGQGFRLCLVLLILVIVLNAIGWWRVRPRPALVTSPPTVDLDAPTAADPWAT
jgi:hypothetical protein